jgi:catechol 2,3-dioxygenase-like lactoylglutathione lyase family enzyme
MGVGDIVNSVAWYQTLVGLPKLTPAHGHFGRHILDADGTVCSPFTSRRAWASPADRPEPRPGNGLLLFFRVDDFDEALPSVRALVSRLEEEPHRNTNTATMEFALRDPDGYHVMVSALYPTDPAAARRTCLS